MLSTMHLHLRGATHARALLSPCSCPFRLSTRARYNGTLRGIHPESPPFFRETWSRLTLGNTYGATILTINAAFAKLAIIQRVGKVYRGLAGKLPRAMRAEDRYGARGGIE